MTYITYNKRQFSDYKNPRPVPLVVGHQQRMMIPETLHCYDYPPKKTPLILPKPKYMPSRLVRTCDMEVVQGSEVSEGYCALSYSWSQSGEIIENKTTGKADVDDEGKHKIVFPAKTVRKKRRGRRRIPRKVKYVTFKGLIQEICKDFNIKYIWYDKMCIDQKDEKEKKCEMRQMHKIYGNAYCALALVPELSVYPEKNSVGHVVGYSTDTDSLLEAEWMKRVWTLEEAIVSSRILLVGSNMHLWWYRLQKHAFFPIFRKQPRWDVNTVLYYAHGRNTTNEHDRLFALANIFPSIGNIIIIDYEQEIQELMLKCYGVLAESDISILCFGPHIHYKTLCKEQHDNDTVINKRERYKVPIQNYEFLPSWTGVHGEHKQHSSLKVPFRSYTINGRTMQVSCAAMTNNQYIANDLDVVVRQGDIPPFPLGEKDGITSVWGLAVLIQLPGDTKDKLVSVGDDFYSSQEKSVTDLFCQDISKALQELSHFVQVKKTNLQWVDYDDWMRDIPRIHFEYSLTEDLQSTTKYVILLGIQFVHNTTDGSDTLYPVIKKDGDYYKSVGICDIWRSQRLITKDYKPEEQIFKIQ